MKEKRRLEKSVNQLSERGHMMGFYCNFLVVKQPSQKNQNSEVRDRWRQRLREKTGNGKDS